MSIKTRAKGWVRTHPRRGWSFIKRFCTIAVFAAFSLIYLTQLTAATDNSLLGVYYGDNGWRVGQVQALERWQGKKYAVMNLFTNWCDQTTVLDNLFNQQLLNIWNNQNIPLISWEPFSCPASANPTDAEVRAITPGDIEVRAKEGQYDTYLNTWSDRMKTFLSGPDGVYNTADDRRAYIRLGHEMNGDWYPWSAAKGSNTPTDYVQMWQHVKSLFYNKGMEWTHLQWIWCVNFTDHGVYRAEAFYPGDSYVDWVSISGYNWGATHNWSKWIAPEQVFGPMLSRLRVLTKKPISITEIGSTTKTSSGINIAAKSQWITDAFNYVLAQNIKMVVWFNHDKETDWATFGGAKGDSTFDDNHKSYKTYAAYKTSVGSNSFISSESNNPRLLTDAKFAGL